MRPCEHQRGRMDVFQNISVICVAHRRTSGYVSVRICGLEHGKHCLGFGGMCGTKIRREPTVEYGASDSFHPAALHALNSLVPHILVAELRSGVAKRKLVKAARGVRTEEHPDHSAHGQAAEMDAIEPQEI